MLRRVSVRGIILHGDKLLCVRLKHYQGSLQTKDNFWCLPGGGLDESEALADGIKREMTEETGVKPVVGNVLYIQQFTHKDVDYLEFFFHITNGEAYLHIDLSKTTHGGKEIAQIAFVDPKATHILPEFLTTEPLVDVALGNGPAKIISRL